MGGCLGHQQSEDCSEEVVRCVADNKLDIVQCFDLINHVRRYQDISTQYLHNIYAVLRDPAHAAGGRARLLRLHRALLRRGRGQRSGPGGMLACDWLLSDHVTRVVTCDWSGGVHAAAAHLLHQRGGGEDGDLLRRGQVSCDWWRAVT